MGKFILNLIGMVGIFTCGYHLGGTGNLSWAFLGVLCSLGVVETLIEGRERQ